MQKSMKITLKGPALDNVQKILCIQSLKKLYLCWRQKPTSGIQRREGQLCPYRTSEFVNGSSDGIHFVPVDHRKTTTWYENLGSTDHVLALNGFRSS